MIDSSRNEEVVERLLDEFAARCRRGESPSILEYVAKYPQYARQIEQLFPAVASMEQLRVVERNTREAALRHTASLPTPSQLGDFDIIQEIGRGGMGVVYAAEQRSLARRVAVKILPRHVLLEEKHRERFQREARTAANLRHTGIVPVFGVGEQGGLHYYVMPLIRGVGLDEIIEELRSAKGDPPDKSGNGARGVPEVEDIPSLVGMLTAQKFRFDPQSRTCSDAAPSRAERNIASHWETTASFGVQAAEALQYAHAQGTLHRDIKPGNVLVDEEGNACLADFGLAGVAPRTDADGDREREVVGTLRYMAPEQLRGCSDARSDIYGLGLTLYELLTLRPAFGERDSDAEPVPPRRIDEAIPRDMEAIVLKCLARDSWRRYQTAAALALDLRHFLEDRPIRARRVSWLEAGWRWCRRNSALAAVSAVAVVLVAVFAAAALVSHIRTRNAYAQTRAALSRAEATSSVALEALEDLYLQLSPERVWIPSDTDPAGQACACVGLRSARPATPAHYIQVQPSEQTAVLLENLLVFYNRLAEQVSDDARIMLESAVATRRAGDIRERLGQVDQAEREYLKAVRKLKSLRALPSADIDVPLELARSYNEVGNVRAACSETEAAHEAHQNALAALRSAAPANPLPEEYRYELARTYFFLSSQHVSHSAVHHNHPPKPSAPHSAVPATFDEKYNTYRKVAIGLLEELTAENPDAADYRFLLALCYRPLDMARQQRPGGFPFRGRQRALEILEALKAEYPQVADYRYELAATYAWVPVGLFPWQGRSLAVPETEEGLRKALAEARWLVDHNPTIPHYARCQALALAKLGTVCSETGRLVEAAELFERALQAQSELIHNFPHVPAHDRVLREFFRLRLALLDVQRRGTPDAFSKPRKSRELLNTCIQNLREMADEPSLTENRLASSTVQTARRALSWSADNPARAP